MGESIIDRVAKAGQDRAHELMPEGFDPWDKVSDEGKEFLRELTRAEIAASRLSSPP